jgi:LPS sulfotransferase NodH
MRANGEPVRFVILNAARTGSNYLCTVLNSHPEILCHHEIFNPHVVGVARHLQVCGFELGTIEERERDPVTFMQRIWKTGVEHTCIGFKLCWRQHEIAYRAVLEDTNVRKIVLKRRNRVKTFVSLLRARQTGEWVIYDDDSAAQPQNPRLHVAHAELMENIEFNEQYYAEIEAALKQTGQRHLTLFYEDLSSETALADALDFLGVSRPDPRLLQGCTRRLMTPPLREIVSNFDELNAALSGTSLQTELHSTEA